MAPRPEQIDIHHLVATGIICEEMHADVAVEQQHEEGRGQDRKCGDDQQICGERCPAKHRHSEVGHARCA
jgi:hypothetical protein